MSNSWLITFLACLVGCLGIEIYLAFKKRYGLLPEIPCTSRSLLSYGSDYMRIGVFPFDTACWMVQMCMRNLMCMRNFNLSRPFEQRRIW